MCVVYDTGTVVLSRKLVNDEQPIRALIGEVDSLLSMLPGRWTSPLYSIRPRQLGVANMPRPLLTPASPRRLGAICSRTEGVPEPYWKRPNMLSCRRYALFQLTV